MLISRILLKFKLVNLYAYQNVSIPAANDLYYQIQSYPSVGSAMDKFLSAFDIPTVSESWPSFAINNNTYNVSIENNFLSVADNILNPITNLNNLTVSSFNFPFALEFLPKTISSTASFFFQLNTNILYTHLPNFRSLKLCVMDPILS